MMQRWSQIWMLTVYAVDQLKVVGAHGGRTLRKKLKVEHKVVQYGLH